MYVSDDAVDNGEDDEEERELVDVGGMKVQADAPGDKEMVDRAKILELRQNLDANLHITTNLDYLLERGKVV